jgi:hypothetical protein
MVVMRKVQPWLRRMVTPWSSAARSASFSSVARRKSATFPGVSRAAGSSGGRGAFVGYDVFGHEVGDGRADGSPADAVLTGQGGDGPTRQIPGADGVGLLGLDGRTASALVGLGLGGRQPVVGQLALEVAL